MTMDEVINVLSLQEEILQFNHFTNEDAWQLGIMLVAESKKRGLDCSITIRKNNGSTVFKYTVKIMEKSSMLLYSELKQNEETLEDIGLDEKEFSCMGGGFPIRVEEVGVIGAIVVTDQNPFINHDIIVKTIGKYLHVDEVPRIRAL